ncbi:MAG TPA: lasso RiPP family leader peptide-containing protein [Vicinamibacterales bacterium]|jgi:hypothetical protein
MSDDHAQRPSGDAPVQSKKPYEAPRLQVYGDIAALTRKVGKTGLVDGGSGTTKATRP